MSRAGDARVVVADRLLAPRRSSVVGDAEALDKSRRSSSIAAGSAKWAAQSWRPGWCRPRDLVAVPEHARGASVHPKPMPARGSTSTAADRAARNLDQPSASSTRTGSRQPGPRCSERVRHTAGQPGRAPRAAGEAAEFRRTGPAGRRDTPPSAGANAGRWSVRPAPR